MAKRPNAQTSRSKFSAIVGRHQEASRVPAADSPRPARKAAKSTDPAFTKLTAYVRKKTHQEVKIRLLQQEQEQGRDFSELVEDLLAGWLKKKPN
jgi:hypothetical protein